MPLREDLKGTKKTVDILAAALAQSIVPTTCPSPSASAHLNVQRRKRTEVQNERPALPQENGRRQTAVQFDPHLPTSRTQDPVDIMTWHCYTRCSSCGLTTGSISDRRNTNFPKTIYTPRRTCHCLTSLTRTQVGGIATEVARHCHKVAHQLQCMPTGEFNGHQVCRMLATSEPMAALLLCMIILLPGETNPLQGQRRALGLEADNIYRVSIPQHHMIIRSSACMYARVCGLWPFARSMCEGIGAKDSG